MKENTKYVPFKIGLNDVGEEVMSAFREYHKINDTSNVLSKGLETLVDNLKKKDVSFAFRGNNEKELLKALLGYKDFCVSDEYHCNQAFEFIKEHIADESIKLTTINSVKPNIITIRKMLGLKATDFSKVFGISHEETLKYYENGGFAETLVKLVANKAANEAVRAMDLPRDVVTVNVSSVYKAEKRKLYNINIDFDVDFHQVNSEVIDIIVQEAEKLKEPIDFFKN